MDELIINGQPLIDKPAKKGDYETYEVAWLKGVGCYGVDILGRYWCTFQAINHTQTCSECGKEIDRGWQLGKWGNESYFCSEHITHPAPNSPGGYKWPLEVSNG